MKVSASAQPDRESHGLRRPEGLRLPTIHRVSVSLWPAGVIAAAYFAAHLPSLAPSLEDYDSINFALGLRDFDPGRHQPHPPGSPVYIALGRLLLAPISAVWPSLAPSDAEALTLALWSAIAGAVALAALAQIFATLAPDRRAPVLWTVAIVAVCPLFWISGLRPMSDLPGLAAATVAQALIVQGRTHRARLVPGALLSGLAAGIRVQTIWLTAPLLVLVMFEQRRAGIIWLASRPLASLAAGVIAWAIPLVVDSGGVGGYLRALSSQAGEDFAWVNMLWLEPTPRRLVFALYETFVLPWGSIPLAVTLAVAAGIGLLVAVVRERRSFAVVLLAFAPYAVFHLMFQETIMVRYALADCGAGGVARCVCHRSWRAARLVWSGRRGGMGTDGRAAVRTGIRRRASPFVPGNFRRGSVRAALFHLRPCTLTTAYGVHSRRAIPCSRWWSRHDRTNGSVPSGTGRAAARRRSGFLRTPAGPTWRSSIRSRGPMLFATRGPLPTALS